jgi:hypothetical protein
MPLNLSLVSHKYWLPDSIASSTSRFVNMIVKSQNPDIPTKSFHLSCMDQNVVRVYIQTLCIFPVSRPMTNTAESQQN